MTNFVNGVNLGGWLSQYREYSHDHFRTFITEPDIQRIASWGLDHVRLPVDSPVLEDDKAPGVPLERGYGYIDECIRWCEAAGLGVILDIHHAPGFSFTHDLEAETKSLNTLFEDPGNQERFINLWEGLVRRYHDAPVPIIFELLNEVVLPQNEPWNALVRRTVPALRAIAPECVIMIGGNHNNAVAGLTGLVEFDDPKIVYTFHFYEPLLFTHQNAPWSAAPREWKEKPSYPGDFPALEAFLATAPQHREEHGRFVGRSDDRELLLEMLQPALDFAARTGRELYCGEFGVAEWVDPESRANWYRDFMGLLREHHIGRAPWSYKQMDFGLVDAGGNVVDEEVLRIVRGEARHGRGPRAYTATTVTTPSSPAKSSGLRV